MKQSADADRFEELLAHRAWVRRVARALVQDESRADDLEQETWIRALGAPPVRSPRAWLATVLRNGAVNLRLAEKRRTSHEAAVLPPTSDAAPAELLERAEVVERVARVVRALEEPYRTAVLLRYFENLSVAAVAGRLGVPLETVRTRLRRALAQLRERLDEEHRGDRRRWAFLLLPLARRPAPAAAGPALAAGTAGAILMTLKSKLAVATALALLGAGVVVWSRADGVEVADVRNPSSVSDTTPSSRPTTPASKPERDPAPEASPDPTPAPARVEGAAVVGRVVDDETGTPVKGARTALVHELTSLDPEKEPWSLTDAEGRFRIDGIGRDRLYAGYLVVLADGYAEAGHRVNGWQENLKDGKPVDLGEARLERGALVTGRVLTADGKIVPGARVLFARDTPVTSPAAFGPNYAREMAVTDSGGRFSIPRLPSARPGYQHTLYAVAETGFGWIGLPPVAGKKVLEAQDIRFALTTCIEVTVRDPGGRPVEGAKVSAEPHFPPLGTNRNWPPSHDLRIEAPDIRTIFEGMTDSSGRIRLDRLPVDGEPCRYDVVASAKEHSRGWTDGIDVTPGETRQVGVDLQAIRSSSFSGAVRDVEGRPVAGAEVNFNGRKGRTDSSGAFRIEGIDATAMNYDPWVVVAAEGFAAEGRRILRSEPWDQGGNEFVLEPGVPVKGQVVDDSGKPLEGAQLTLYFGDMGLETGRSGPDGRFALKTAGGVKSRLLAYPPEPHTDWQVHSAVGVPADGSEIQVVLRRAPAGTRVIAEIFDAVSGRPIDPVESALESVNRRSALPVFGTAPRMEPERVVMDRVQPGEWILWVRAEGRAPAHLAIQVDEGRKEMTVRIPCEAPGTVRGRLEGVPAGTAGRWKVFLSMVGVDSKPQWVRLNPDPKLFDSAWVEPDGTFRIEGVPPCRLRIRSQGKGFMGETEVEVLAGAEVEAVVRLVPQGRATFRTAGAPPRSAVLVRFATEGGSWGPWTYMASRDQSPPEWTTNVPTGRVRWEARFVEKGDHPIAEGPVDAAGEFEAKAGETIDVSIPVR